MIITSEKLQKTISNKINFEGVGLHTGEHCKLTLHPASIDYGIKFVINNTVIPSDVDNVISTNRGTNLLKHDILIMTVEHLLSALYALEIDNLKIELSNSELPILDGTSQIFLKNLNKVGFKVQDKKRKELFIEELISFKSSKGVQFYLIPNSQYKFTYHLEYQNIDILNQEFSIILEKNNYEKEISYAKTFCLLSELLNLYNHGLIKGGSLKNAIVYIDKKLNKKELDKIKNIFNMSIDINYSNSILNNIKNISKHEAAKHKTLDLIGDCSLLGARIKGHLIAHKSGHESNVEFIKYLKKNYLNGKLDIERKGKNMYNIKQILEVMPHRYPFLLVDKILHLEPSKSVSAIKNVTINEPFFLGHFPDKPVMPGVLLLESMAQAGGFLVLHSIDKPNQKLIYLSSIKSAKFKEVAQPGDQLLIKAKLDKFKMGTCKIISSIYVDNKLITECELLASVVDRYE